MIFHVGASKYGATPGIHLAYFRGVQPRAKGNFGPGVNWNFEIAEGADKGRIVSRITASIPSLSNTCGKMLQGVTGQPLKDNEQIDVAPYEGELYRVRVDPKPQGRGVRVTQVSPAPKGREVPRVGFTREAVASAPVRWVQFGDAEPIQTTQAHVQARIDQGMDPQEIWIHDGNEWRRAPEFGFTTCPRSAPPPPRTSPGPHAGSGDGRSSNGKPAAATQVQF